MNLNENKNKKIIFITVVIAILIIIALVIFLVMKNKSKNTSTFDGNGVSSYLNEQDSVNDTYLKMAKEVWKQEEILLEAVKNGDIETLVKNARDDEYMIDDFVDNPDQEYIDAASEYLKFMYADLTWTEPDEETYENWAVYLEKTIKQKLKGEGLLDDWIRLSTDELIQGKKFYKISSTYEEVYPNASGKWSNETTQEAYEKLKATLNQIPTDILHLDIDILEFDTKGNFVLAYDSLLEDTEIERLHDSYWYKNRYGDDSWVGHFIMEEVLD